MDQPHNIQRHNLRKFSDAAVWAYRALTNYALDPQSRVAALYVESNCLTVLLYVQPVQKTFALVTERFEPNGLAAAQTELEGGSVDCIGVVVAVLDVVVDDDVAVRRQTNSFPLAQG